MRPAPPKTRRPASGPPRRAQSTEPQKAVVPVRKRHAKPLCNFLTPAAEVVQLPNTSRCKPWIWPETGIGKDVSSSLAHTNVPGSRHDKRWQDVEELLAGREPTSAGGSATNRRAVLSFPPPASRDRGRGW